MAALLWEIRTCLPLILFTESLDVGSDVRIGVLLAGARFFESGVVMSQSGLHFLVTAWRSWRRSSRVGRPKDR